MSACTEKMMADLQALLGRRLRGEVMAHLVASRQPQGSAAIAAAISRPPRAVQMAVCQMIVRGQLVAVGRDGTGRPAYRPVEIGACEWCGLVSHRLVAGECPPCAAQTYEPPRPGLARRVC